MAKVFDLSVVGFICCNLRPAVVLDQLLLQLDTVKFPAETEPIPATITNVLSDQTVPDVTGTGTDTGTIYTVSVEDADMPPGLNELDEADIVGWSCPGCCEILKNKQLRESILLWTAGEVVKTGDYRLANDIIWKSNSDRTTGASFDLVEQSSWTQVFADSTAALANETAARIAADDNLQAQLNALTPQELGVARFGAYALPDGPNTDEGSVTFGAVMPDANYALRVSLETPPGGNNLSLSVNSLLATGFSFKLGNDVPAAGYKLHYEATAI